MDSQVAFIGLGNMGQVRTPETEHRGPNQSKHL